MEKDKVSPYRPISLLSVIGKLFERILVNRIEESYANRNLCSQKQFGFRPNKSTTDAFIAFKKGVLTERKYVIALFADIQGAFDNLWWPAIKSRVIDAGYSSNLLNIINSYFSNRRVEVAQNFAKVKRKLQEGCPQGSIIGPSAWNRCIDSPLLKIEEELQEDQAETFAYADDLVFLIKGNSRNEIEHKKILKKIKTDFEKKIK